MLAVPDEHTQAAPEQSGKLCMAVASDLHAYSGADSEPPSALGCDASVDDPTLNPIVGLEELAAVESLTAEVVLCPGDVADRASPEGLIFGWSMVNRLADALQAQVIATAGNHDLTSRPASVERSPDPQETLKDLSPTYPYNDRRVQQAFFSDHYAIVTGPDWRVVSLNTSAHHGLGAREYDHGRITPRTRQRLMRDLRDLPPKPINVLLCHHHPIEYAEFDEADRSTIVGGALVLKALQSGDYGPWLVVHGHKHVAHLAYAPGAGASPVLFSAGSVSAYLSGPQSERASNQFYVIEFDEMAAAHIPAQMAARFRSWSWVSGDGWKPSLPGAGLPSHGGFGIRVDPRRTAKDIADALVRAGRKALTWQELVSARPEVEFLIPDDLSLVATELERAGYGVQRASDGRYDEVRSPLDCAR